MYKDTPLVAVYLHSPNRLTEWKRNCHAFVSKARNTVLKFKDKSLRDKIFDQRKKAAISSIPSENIYFNDQLTKHRQNLLYAARNLVKSKKLFAAWA